ncbi:MAG TPA: 1,4-alpha-glucan branching enzyme, partial [Rhodocyclaceae bacterium]|nr:1,4-alpha-glucan branching enzyme [Rhodocyclaceae bacterium]
MLRVFQPHATEVAVEGGGEWVPLARQGDTDFFAWSGEDPPFSTETPYRLRITSGDDCRIIHDAYNFPLVPSEHDMFLFGQGTLTQAYDFLGANLASRRGVDGICFRVWAPNAERVSVIGEFNRWDGRVHPMGNLGASGIWELFIPDLPVGTLYKFEIRNRHTGAIFVKSDPYAREWEMRPATAAR